MKNFRALLLLALLPCTVAFANSPIAAFKAEYVALRNNKEVARTTIQLSENPDSTWTLRTSTVGTSALAKMAGLDVAEESVVRWVDGRPETLSYDFRQDIAFKNRARHGEFDWDARQVHMVDGKSDVRYGLVPYTIDRHALTLALASDLSRNSDRFEYKVAHKSAIEDVNYTECGQSSMSVPAGTFTTRCLERVRENRTSKSWFDQANGWIPVQIEHVESKDKNKAEVITLKLASIERRQVPG
ncbi:DUF3108 domain-containing protein [Dokdonella sp.]|uniref:DUF3108 domain-containing protein n=1 Tax=Dokdonella sp. TaxID=2291710 RepID=UPI003C4115A9